MKAVIDTNVLLIANNQHSDVSDECVMACVEHLQHVMAHDVVVIDDNFLILGEYLNKTNANTGKGVGDVFLKWLLQNLGSIKHVEQVSLTDLGDEFFAEFPDLELQKDFDAADRKFPAVSNAHPDKPPVFQAADSKWLDWWPQLLENGVEIRFLCPDDICGFYFKKFPHKKSCPLPPINP